MESKLRRCEIEKAELGAKEQSQKEAYQQAASEKLQIENELNAKILQQKKEFERTIEDINLKMTNAQE